jgi:hypothetical protein
MLRTLTAKAELAALAAAGAGLALAGITGTVDHPFDGPRFRGTSDRPRSTRYLAVAQALRGLFTGPVANLVPRRVAARTVPELASQVRSLGRSFGRDAAALEK